VLNWPKLSDTSKIHFFTIRSWRISGTPGFGPNFRPGEFQGTVPLNFLHILVGRDAFASVTDWARFEDVKQNREIISDNMIYDDI